MDARLSGTGELLSPTNRRESKKIPNPRISYMKQASASYEMVAPILDKR